MSGIRRRGVIHMVDVRRYLNRQKISHKPCTIEFNNFLAALTGGGDEDDDDDDMDEETLLKDVDGYKNRDPMAVELAGRELMKCMAERPRGKAEGPITIYNVLQSAPELRTILEKSRRR